MGDGTLHRRANLLGEPYGGTIDIRVLNNGLVQMTWYDTKNNLVQKGLGFKMGQSLKLGRAPHNRLLMSLAHSFGHNIKTFGNPAFCDRGPLELS